VRGQPGHPTDLLRGELGFRAPSSPTTGRCRSSSFHRVAADRGAAAQLALSARLDGLPATDFYGSHSGRVAAGDCPWDPRCVRRVLRMKFQLGLLSIHNP
jgi:hypothetical protein